MGLTKIGFWAVLILIGVPLGGKACSDQELILRQCGFYEEPNDYRLSEPGPYETATDKSVGPGGEYTVYRPNRLGGRGELHGLVVWGNGTFMKPGNYSGLLKHFASYGFIVVASNSSWTGSGKAMSAGMDWLLKENENSESQYYRQLTGYGCSVGHSQGAEGALRVGARSDILCSVPIQPAASGNAEALSGPSFVISGETDGLVSAKKVEGIFSRISTPSVLGELLDAGHFAPMQSATPAIRNYITAWLLLHLKGQVLQFSQTFWGEDCEICGDKIWKTKRNEY